MNSFHTHAYQANCVTTLSIGLNTFIYCIYASCIHYIINNTFYTIKKNSSLKYNLIKMIIKSSINMYYGRKLFTI